MTLTQLSIIRGYGFPWAQCFGLQIDILHNASTLCCVIVPLWLTSSALANRIGIISLLINNPSIRRYMCMIIPHMRGAHSPIASAWGILALSTFPNRKKCVTSDGDSREYKRRARFTIRKLTGRVGRLSKRTTTIGISR